MKRKGNNVKNCRLILPIPQKQVECLINNLDEKMKSKKTIVLYTWI